MYKAQDSKETYLLLSQISKSTTIPYGTLYYYAVKFKMRFFIFSGRRYLEFSCAKELICFIKPKRDLVTQNAIDNYLDALL